MNLPNLLCALGLHSYTGNAVFVWTDEQATVTVTTTEHYGICGRCGHWNGPDTA